MTVEPDAAPFAARPAPTPRTGVFSPAVWAAMILALISLLAATAFVLGPRLMGGHGFFRQANSARAPLVASDEPRAEAPGAALAAPTAAPPSPAPADAGLAGRVATLEARQDRILNAATEALAVAALSRAADQPQPFAQALGAFAKAIPGPETAALAPLALQGAPTRTQLARGLDDLASRVAAEARVPAEGASLPARIAYALSRLVSIRQVDPAGSGPDAIIARAEIAANAGDIEGALNLLSRLPASSNGVLAAWRDSARRRVAIDQALAGLQAVALTDLASARSAPP